MKRKSSCTQCGRPDAEVGRISRRGLCSNCALENINEFNRQMAAKRGPAYNLWVQRQTHGAKMYQERLNYQTGNQPHPQ